MGPGARRAHAPKRHAPNTSLLYEYDFTSNVVAFAFLDISVFLLLKRQGEHYLLTMPWPHSLLAAFSTKPGHDARYLVERQSPDLWGLVLNPENQDRECRSPSALETDHGL